MNKQKIFLYVYYVSGSILTLSWAGHLFFRGFEIFVIIVSFLITALALLCVMFCTIIKPNAVKFRQLIICIVVAALVFRIAGHIRTASSRLFLAFHRGSFENVVNESTSFSPVWQLQFVEGRWRYLNHEYFEYPDNGSYISTQSRMDSILSKFKVTPEKYEDIVKMVKKTGAIGINFQPDYIAFLWCGGFMSSEGILYLKEGKEVPKAGSISLFYGDSLNSCERIVDNWYHFRAG